MFIGTDEVDEYAKRSDTLILITYKPFVRKVGVLSIPRDTLVNFSENKIVKINSFAYGYTHGKLSLQENL